MAKKQENIFADLFAKRHMEETKKKFTSLQPNGSFSPTETKLKSTRELLERKLELIESGEAPYCPNALNSALYVELTKNGVETGKASIICSNANRRIINAYCHSRMLPVNKWSITETNRGMNLLTTKEYCDLIRLAIKLPIELCSDLS